MQRFFQVLVVFAVLVGFILQGISRAVAPSGRVLETVLMYRVDVPGAKGKHVRLWIPVPSPNRWQQIRDLRVETKGAYRVTQEPAYGNRMIYVEFVPDSESRAVRVAFRVRRMEPRAVLSGAPAEKVGARAGWKKFALFLKPARRVPVGGRWAELARSIIKGAETPLAKVRAVYEHIVTTMRYDYEHQSPKRGEGDVPFVCDFKRGNCLDLHSYGVTLLRSLGIPAYVEAGFPLTGIPIPSVVPGSGKIGGYHCWTWVYVPRTGWIPFDASDARRWVDAGIERGKMYLFGRLLLERSAVAFSRGRDIVLEPPQAGGPLNVFNAPYAEADGRPVRVTWVVEYRVLRRPRRLRWTGPGPLTR